MRRIILIIHNPVAGRRNRALLNAVEQALAGFECSVTVRQTVNPGDAEWIARSSGAGAGAGDWDAVVALIVPADETQ
ncbi:MAG: hypothetical protein O3A85_11305 [Proteobacteria bacterium]|nr:hypothetical protein [Pseudomonadota bacterium]